MTVLRDDLHARLDHLPEDQLDQVAALLDALAAATPLPPGRNLGDANVGSHLVSARNAGQERAQHAASDTSGTPLPLTWGTLLERAREISPDPVFANDLESVHRELNQPVRDPWAASGASMAPEPHG